jgi:hypothetical protein
VADPRHVRLVDRHGISVSLERNKRRATDRHPVASKNDIPICDIGLKTTSPGMKLNERSKNSGHSVFLCETDDLAGEN